MGHLAYRLSSSADPHNLANATADINIIIVVIVQTDNRWRCCHTAFNTLDCFVHHTDGLLNGRRPCHQRPQANEDKHRQPHDEHNASATVEAAGQNGIERGSLRRCGGDRVHEHDHGNDGHQTHRREHGELRCRFDRPAHTSSIGLALPLVKPIAKT